ncbi:hypothetical protein C804_03576 [Lachnospiraceae bacterium A4]|nr:hypothetical protein C804_03576 [Lachnospiraceae bacterium A4]
MKFNKILLLSAAILLSTSVAPTLNVSAKENVSNISDQSSTIVPLSENIGWRYKIENGNLYKRLYNYSMSQWVGDWILCP